MTTYTNRVGQTIFPGDRVVVIAQGRSHFIKEREGVFVGLSPSGLPQARVKDDVSTWRHPDGTTSRKWCDGASYAGRTTVELVRTYYAGRVYKLA